MQKIDDHNAGYRTEQRAEHAHLGEIRNPPGALEQGTIPSCDKPEQDRQREQCHGPGVIVVSERKYRSLPAEDRKQRRACTSPARQPYVVIPSPCGRCGHSRRELAATAIWRTPLLLIPIPARATTTSTMELKRPIKPKPPAPSSTAITFVRTMPMAMTRTDEPPIRAEDLRICVYDFCIRHSPTPQTRRADRFSYDARLMRFLPVADVTDHASGNANHEGIIGDVRRHNRASADERALAYGDPGDYGHIGADRGAALHTRRRALPVSAGLQRAVLVRRLRKDVVREHHAVADEDLVLDGDTFTEKGMGRDLAARANATPL